MLCWTNGNKENRDWHYHFMGAGKAFAAGADISNDKFFRSGGALFAQKGQATLRRLEESKYPTMLQ